MSEKVRQASSDKVTNGNARACAPRQNRAVEGQPALEAHDHTGLRGPVKVVPGRDMRTDLLSLQRKIGNRAVGCIVERATLRAGSEADEPASPGARMPSFHPEPPPAASGHQFGQSVPLITQHAPAAPHSVTVPAPRDPEAGMNPVTVSEDALLHDSDAVQKALRASAPGRDRAVHLVVGPCSPNSVVLIRDPEDEEVPDDEDDIEVLGDVGNFAGVYVRDLDTGALVERHPYAGRIREASSITGTSDWIAVQVRSGVDIMQRGSGVVEELPGAILDVEGQQVVRVRNGAVEAIMPLCQMDGTRGYLK